jgi:hypothetical protein
MTPVTTMPTRDRLRPRSRLQLIPDEQRRPPAPSKKGGMSAGNVLVAGADASGRRRMIQEMRGLLPEGASFVEAGETWQVLGLAAQSRMVIVVGDVGEVSARGLVNVLGRRHPMLPVIALTGTERRLIPSGDVGVASL